MLIKKITIENFQAYNGIHEIEFSKGLNLIIGKGGKGKSKLFNAFYWVLFGRIYITDVGWCDFDGLPQSSRGAMQKHELVNARALSIANIGDTVSTSVKLDIEDDKGDLYTIERSISCVRKQGKEFDSKFSWEIGNSKVKAFYEIGTGTKVDEGINAEEIIRSLFPKEIRNYIWFQGESLQNLIDFNDKETLKNAVKYISYYPFYEKLSAIITNSKSRIERQETQSIRQLNSHNAQVNACLAEIQSIRDSIVSENKKLQKYEADKQLVEQAIAEDDAKLQGLAMHTQLVREYDQCEAKLNDVKKQLDAIDAYQKAQLPSLWIMRNIDPLVNESKKLIDKYSEEVFSTPEQKYFNDPGRSKLEEILRDHKCFVCGSDVSDGSAAYHHIMQRLAEQDAYFKAQEEFQANLAASKKFTLFMGKMQDFAESLVRSLSEIDNQLIDSEDQLNKYLAARKRITEEKADLDKKIEDIKRQNGVDPVRQAGMASRIGYNIQTSRTNLDTIKRNINATKSSISNLKAKLTIVEKKLEDLGAANGAQVKVPETEWKLISTFLEDICKKVKEQARIDLLHKIEERANKFYEIFTAHDVGYKGNVKIADDYTIEFDAGLNTSHNDRKKMSIINALLSLNQEAMNVYYPFISDAPTSNFDIETTFKYLLGIKDIFGQTIIMTKDVEIGSEAYQKLMSESKITRIYELTSDVHVSGVDDPDRHEVSTNINPLK